MAKQRKPETISIYLSPQLRAEVKAVAELEGTSMSRLARRGLEMLLAIKQERRPEKFSNMKVAG
jgi:hypothetical protein